MIEERQSFKFTPPHDNMFFSGAGRVYVQILVSLLLLVLSGILGFVVATITMGVCRNTLTIFVFLMEVVLVILALFSFRIILPFVVAYFVTKSDISLSENADTIHIRVFPFMKFYKKLDSEVDLRFHQVKNYFRHGQEDTSDENSRFLYAIELRGLPRLFSLVGMFYRIGYVPVFVVTSNHENYKQLLSILREIECR